MRPMLADSISVEDLPLYCTNDKFMTEQKVDGHRKLVTVDNGTVTVAGRNGQPTDLTAIDEFRRVNGRFTFDGEQLPGGRFVIFDLVEGGIMVTPRSPASFRRDVLDKLFAAWNPGPSVQLLPCARTSAEKLTMVRRLIERKAEGVILRHVDGLYLPGVRSQKLLKAKFVKDIDCFVTELRRGGKENIVVAVYDGDRMLEFECTARAGDGSEIQVGDVVTVKYLYAVDPHAPRLVQPTYPKIRGRWKVVDGQKVGDPRFPNDKIDIECLSDQIIYTDKTVWPDLLGTVP